LLPSIPHLTFANFAQIDNNLHVDCAANGERKRKIGEKKVL